MDVQPEGLEETAKLVGPTGSTVETRTCDVGQEADVEASIAACIEHFGRIDTIANVAGILRFSHSHEVDTETWQRIQRINVDGTFFVIRAALPHLLEVGGSVVNVSSVAAKAGLPYGLAYAASKGAVLSMTEDPGGRVRRQGRALQLDLSGLDQDADDCGRRRPPQGRGHEARDAADAAR